MQSVGSCLFVFFVFFGFLFFCFFGLDSHCRCAKQRLPGTVSGCTRSKVDTLQYSNVCYDIVHSANEQQRGMEFNFVRLRHMLLDLCTGNAAICALPQWPVLFFFWFVCLEFEEGVQSSEHSSPGCDIRMEVYGFGITTAQHPKLNSPLGPNPLGLEVGIGEHAADWAACSLVVLHFPSLFRRSSVQVALPLFCMQQIMAMTRLQMLSCLPDAG